MQIQTVHCEPELAVDRCLGVQRWDFDPMLVEVEAGLTSQAMSEVALAVDLCLFRAERVRLEPNLTKAITPGVRAGWGIPTPGPGQLPQQPGRCRRRRFSHAGC